MGLNAFGLLISLGKLLLCNNCPTTNAILPWQYTGIACFIERGKFFLPLSSFTATESCKCIIMRLIHVLLHTTLLNKQGSAGDNDRTCTETRLTMNKH